MNRFGSADGRSSKPYAAFKNCFGVQKAKTGSDIVIEILAKAGVDVCFVNPGTTEMWLVKSLAAEPRVRSVLALHETICSGACDGYARMRGKPAACLLHMGPGFANGIANFHNAKKARSPIVAIIGNVATWHSEVDAPLSMDIEGLARTVAHSVRIPRTIHELKLAAYESYRDAAFYPENTSQSRIAALVVPHDLSWEEVSNSASFEGHPSQLPEAEESINDEMRPLLDNCIQKIREKEQGKVAILVGGQATLADDDTVVMVGKIAAKLRAVLYCHNWFSRIDRGNGRPHMRRLPLYPKEAKEELSAFELIVTLDCCVPVPIFGYEDGPGKVISLGDDCIWRIEAGKSTKAVIRYLFKQTNAQSIVPEHNCLGMFAPPSHPDMVASRSGLTAQQVCVIVAKHQPANAIIVDESMTSGVTYWESSKGCPPFTHLSLTGGAIGSGPTMSIGAAIACPERIVINLQADGSAMFSPQAFWTQAKENLHIVTIICSNRSYAVLKNETARQSIQHLKSSALSQMTDLSKPTIDWVQLVASMGVRAAKAQNTQELARYLQIALESTKGPFVIEAVLH